MQWIVGKWGALAIPLTPPSPPWTVQGRPPAQGVAEGIEFYELALKMVSPFLHARTNPDWT